MPGHHPGDLTIGPAMTASYTLPGRAREPKWLPAPAGGPFSRTARIYWPPPRRGPGGTCKLSTGDEHR